MFEEFYTHASHCVWAFFPKNCVKYITHVNKQLHIYTYYFYNNRLTGRQHKYVPKQITILFSGKVTPLKVNEKGAKTILMLNMLNLKTTIHRFMKNIRDYAKITGYEEK